MTHPSPKISDSLAAGLCALAALTAVILIGPVANIGMNDDWSYSHMAIDLARSGRLTYNGWTTPMVGLQAYWAALLIHLFGFSFQLMAVSILPFVCGSASLLYLLGRDAGLDQRGALLTAFATFLSPLYVPETASFMTDIPGFFFVLLTIWISGRAVAARSDMAFATWILLLAASSVAGGSIRQIDWLTGFVFLPYIAWINLKSRRFPIALAGWIIALVCSAALAMWFKSQPYVIDTPLFDRSEFGFRSALINLAELALKLLVLLLPVLVLMSRDFLRLPRRSRAIIGAGSFALAAVVILAPHLKPSLPSIPFAHLPGNIVTQYGLLMPDVEILGDKPIVLPPVLQVILIGTALSLASVALLRCWIYRRAASASLVALRQQSSLAIPVVLGLFTAAYGATVISRALLGLAFDRYLIPFLPVAAYLLVGLVPAGREKAVMRWAWGLCILFGLYGIATAHDFYARSRARAVAIDHLLSAHVPRTAVTAGVEFDGWTQLDETGYLNDPRIKNPPGAYKAVPERTFGLKQPYWFWNTTLSVEPRYFVVLSAQDGLCESGWQPVEFRTWLPPFHGSILTQSRPPDCKTTAARATGL